MHARTIGTALVTGFVALSARAATAQMPGLPVLQNAFTAPGVEVAANFGGGAGSAYAGAASWAPGNARFQLSAALGAFTPTGGSSAMAYGLRAATSVFSLGGGNVGVGAFLGFGGSAAQKGGARPPSQVPLGASIGFRHTMGTRGFSLYGTPMVQFTSAPAGGKSSSTFRVGVGADVALTRSLGATAGVELGTTAATTGGPNGTRWGVALSWALGR